MHRAGSDSDRTQVAGSPGNELSIACRYELSTGWTFLLPLVQVYVDAVAIAPGSVLLVGLVLLHFNLKSANHKSKITNTYA